MTGQDEDFSKNFAAFSYALGFARGQGIMAGADEKTAGYMDRYFALLQKQLDRTDDWPDSFTFPEPRDSTEREAFEAFILKLQSANIHIEPVEFTTEPGHT